MFVIFLFKKKKKKKKGYRLSYKPADQNSLNAGIVLIVWSTGCGIKNDKQMRKKFAGLSVSGGFQPFSRDQRKLNSRIFKLKLVYVDSALRWSKLCAFLWLSAIIF